LRRSREFVRANREFETAIQRFPDDVFRKFGGVSLEVSWFDSAKLMLSVGSGNRDEPPRIRVKNTHVIVTSAKQILCTEKRDFAVPADFGYCRCPNAGVIAPDRGPAGASALDRASASFALTIHVAVVIDPNARTARCVFSEVAQRRLLRRAPSQGRI
jgi:hypothetical protein